MPRPRNPFPTYRHHKPSNTARCWVDGRWQSLGAWDSPESKEAFARILAELANAPAIIRAKSKRLTLNEVILSYAEHAEVYYRRRDGSKTNEVQELFLSLRPVRELYGRTEADEFGPLKLKTVRTSMMSAGLSRKTINQRVGRIKRFFRWAASEELVRPETHQALTTVSGLSAGRSMAREPEPVAAVSIDLVEATLPHVNRHVRGLIEFQQRTGCRPGEAVLLRMADIDKSEKVWFFRPSQHKASWRGQRRSIAIGPKCQAMLAEFDTGDDTDYLFSPARAVAEQHAERGEKRKTPKYPSHMKRNITKRVDAGSKARPPADHYTTASYGKAIQRGCDAGKVDHWSPNQLRHAFATEVRKRFGLEAAQVMLGHKHADVTQIYAERNDKVAGSLAEQMG